MKHENAKQLLANEEYEAPKCEVVEMMGEGNLLLGSVEGGDGGGEWGRSSRRRDDDEDDF